MRKSVALVFVLSVLLGADHSGGFREPAWWDEGIVLAGNWEPLLFRIRLGRDAVTGREQREDVTERYLREHSEETVIKLKEAGVNLIVAHFYKTGLESEREEVELTKRLAALCHKHGMKIGTYIGDTIFTETLLRDMPSARQWVRYMENGEAVRYPGQPYRLRADFNHPGYVEYIKSVIRIAVEEVKTDLIHFDNVLLREPPMTGATPEINRRFREFLRSKYGTGRLKERLGFSDIRGVTVPSWAGLSNPAAMPKITDPVIQEWIDFRCHDLADYYGKLAAYARSLNPDVVVELNPHGIEGDNRAFLHGVDHSRLTPHGSAFWTEEPNNAGVEDGIVVSKIRSLKAARRLGETLFVKCRFVHDPSVDPKRPTYKIRMAEAMAFSRNCLGDVGKPLDVYEMPEGAKRYIRFYRDNNRWFSGARPVADVAVLRSFASMAYNSVEPHAATALVEQALIQYKIPFDIIFDQQLDALSRYRAVILGDQECLSNEALARIREYVRAGGGLLATGRTSMFTEWRRLRQDLGLSDVLGVHTTTGDELPPPRRGTFGNGRTVYVPQVMPAGPLPAPPALLPRGFVRQYWRLPKNTSEILEAVRYAAGAAMAVESDGAPLTTVMELTEKDDGSARILHWVNYEMDSNAPAVTVSVALPVGKMVDAVELLSPDRDKPERLAFAVKNGRVSFRMAPVAVYNIAIMRLVPQE